MKMKEKMNLILLLTLMGILFFAACDKIEEPLVIIDEQYATDGFLDTLYVMDSVLVNEKHVLLEDFTGIKCVNCPEAALAAHALAADLNHKLIIYSVHAGYYAEPDATGYYTADYRCLEGNELNTSFAILANPIALIDRVKYNGSLQVGSGNWEAAVMVELEKENTVDLKMLNIYYPNLNKMQINVVTKFHTATSGKYRLVLYIGEDGIVSPQRNNNPSIGPSPDWLDYEHFNILRGAVNSTFGGIINPDVPIVPGKEYSSQFIYDLNPAWVASNCNIIAYVYEDESDEVMQVAELRIKTSE